MSCRKCWTPSARPVEVAKDDAVVAIGELCDACFDRALEGAAALRVEFESLLAAGVSREAANDFLIAKINAEASS